MEMSTAEAAYKDAVSHDYPFLRHSEEFQKQKLSHAKRAMGPPVANPDQLFSFAKWKRRQIRKRIFERDADDPIRRIKTKRIVRGFKFFDARKRKS